MEYRFNTLLTRTAHVSQNYLRPYLDELGLSVGQPKVLRCLTALGPCSQRVLADYCEVDPSAICRTLDNMERKGLLTRQQSKKDRRTGEVALTRKGQEVFQAWESRCMEMESRMLQGFSEEEKKQLVGYLARAYRNVGGRLL